MNRSIGLFGGSFDPPHCGHETLVREALKYLDLDEVWVIPAGLPVHRNLSGHANAELRMVWVEAMFSESPNVHVKDWEVSQSEPVAAIQTIKTFRDVCPDVVPLWLCGADSFATMKQWVDYPEHQALCNVVVFARAGEAVAEQFLGWKPLSSEAWRSSQKKGQSVGPGHIIWLDVSLPDISASNIRGMAAHGKSLKGLVNSRIRKEIESRYKPGTGETIE